jgi:hypothetical protein
MPELKGTINHSTKNNDLHNPFGFLHMLSFPSSFLLYLSVTSLNKVMDVYI